MYYLNQEKIEVKKTKTILTVSFDTKDKFNQTPEEAFKRLLAISVLSGGNTNCIRQTLNCSTLNKSVNFELMDSLKNQMDSLIFDCVKEINRCQKEYGMSTESISFR